MSLNKKFVPSLVSILYDKCPHIDRHLHDYIISVLSGDDIKSVSDVFDAIGEMLVSCNGNDDDDDVMKICDDLFNALNEEKNENALSLHSHRTLESPIDLNILALRLSSCVTDDWKSIWSDKRDIDSKVDAKKLGKAEAKLKAKAEKRELSDNGKESDGVIMAKAASASQMINKKDTKSESRGNNRVKDIKIENFDIAFGDNVLLKSADLTLSYGRRYGLCGRNGIGKSTLLTMIWNGSLVIPNHISILHVQQEVTGDDTSVLESVLQCFTLRNQLINEERHLSSKKDNLTSEEMNRLIEVYQQLNEIEADKSPAKASVILSGLGFTATMQSQPTKQFSGGWRMRIALARALFSKPDLLLLDEPTNMLDMKAIVWLENYLINEWKSTLLVVSHDRKFLSIVPTDILHFHSYRIDSYHGDYEQFIKSMTEKLKNQQREYESQVMYRQHAQEFIDKFRFNAKRASLVQSRIKALEKLPELKPIEKESLIIFKFPETEVLSPPILQLDDVSFAYVSGTEILKKLNVNVLQDSRICIVGDNGSGKTTLLKLLTGELSPTKGLRHAHRNLSIGYFSQHHVDQLTMNQSPIEFLAKKFPGKSSEHYRRCLGRFGITGDLSLQSVESLSGGQKSRVAFTAISMLNPNILILDEPTNHLDVETVDALGNALNQFTGGVILVTHDEQLIRIVCKDLWHCHDTTVTVISDGFDEYRAMIDRELLNL